MTEVLAVIETPPGSSSTSHISATRLGKRGTKFGTRAGAILSLAPSRCIASGRRPDGFVMWGTGPAVMVRRRCTKGTLRPRLYRRAVSLCARHCLVPLCAGNADPDGRTWYNPIFKKTICLWHAWHFRIWNTAPRARNKATCRTHLLPHTYLDTPVHSRSQCADTPVHTALGVWPGAQTLRRTLSAR